jgi:hypothetical protein
MPLTTHSQHTFNFDCFSTKAETHNLYFNVGLRGSGKPFSIAYFDERRDGIHGRTDGIHGRGEGRVGGGRGGKGASNEGVGDEGLIEEMICGIDEMRDVQEVSISRFFMIQQ